MKRIFAWVLLFAMVLGMFAGCKKEETPAPTTVPAATEEVITADDAMAYLKALYPKSEEAMKTPVDYERQGIVRVGGIPFTIVWSTDLPEEQIKAVVSEDGSKVTMDVNENCEADTPYVLTATITDEYGNSASTSWNCILPKAADMVSLVKEAYALKAGESLPYEATLRGKIINIDTAWNPEYQNITVTIAVEGAEDMPIECYRLKGDGADKLQVGNIITVTGTLKNYNGTIEFDAGCILDAVEQGDAVEALTDVGEILKAAYKLKDGKSLGYSVELTGVVIEIDKPYDPGYKNISVVIEMEGYKKYPILCYRLKGADVENIAVGDTITVNGLIKNYQGTIEYDAGCQMTKRVSGGGVAAKPSADEAKILKDAKKLKEGQKLDYIATLTGEVISVDTAYDSQYKNCTVTMLVNGTKIQCYRMKGDDAANVRVTDKITVTGQIENYFGKLEFGSGCTLDNWVKGSRVVKIDMGPLAENTAYKMEMKLPPLSKNVYFNGKISDSHYLQTGTYEEGVDVYMEKTEKKGVRFYFLDGETKTYIEIKMVNVTNKDGTTSKKARPQLTTNPGVYWTYSKEAGVYTVDIDGTKYYVGTYDNNGTIYETASCSSIYYITDANEKNKGKTQFYFEFVTKASDAPDAPETPDVPTISGLPTTTEALKNGDKVVIFAPAYSKALSTQKVATYYNKGVDLTVVDNALAGYGDTETWTVIVNEDGTYSFANGGKNIALADEFSSMNLGEKHDDWQLISLGDGLYNIKNVGRNSFIEWYASKDNWSTYNSDSAATSDLFQLSIYVIGKGVLTEEAENPGTPDVPVVPEEPETPEEPEVPAGPTLVEAPVAGTAYKFGMVQANVENKLFFINGAMNGYYMDTTEDAAAAADVYLEATEGGYYLYTMVEGAKKYINMVVSGTHVNGAFEDAAATVYTYDAEAKTVIATANDAPYWFGTRNDKTYTTVGPVKTEYEGFYCQFYTTGKTETPEEPEVPAGPTLVEAPVAGTAYKFGMVQANVENKLFFINGAMNGYYMDTTEDAAAAADVYLEATEGGYYLYTMVEGAKKYINMVVSGTHVNGAFEDAAATVYTYDAEAKTVIATINDAPYWFGTRNDKTYTTVGPVKTEYEGFYCQFYTTGKTETPEEPEVPAGPTLVEAPVAGTAYKFGMVQANVENKLFFINGAMNGYYMDTTEDAAAAADVYLEATEGGYYLYTMVEGAKKYINMVVSGTHVNGAFEDAAATVYTYDAEAKTVIATINDAPYWFGTRNDKTYTTVGPVKTEYEGFYCQFYTTGKTETPETPEEPETPEVKVDYVTEPKAATAYKLGFKQIAKSGNVYYFTGAMSGYYGASDTDISKAVDMYLEAVTGGYNLYFKDGDTKKYINIVASGTHINFTFGDTATSVFVFDEEVDALCTTVNDLVYYMGTNGTFVTFGTIEQKNIANDTYYPARFYAVETAQPETPETPAEPVFETLTIAEALEIGKAQEHNTYTEKMYKVTGMITEVYNASYGNMYITDGKGNTLTIYGTYDASGEVSYKDMEKKPDAGDTVTILGVIGQYSNNPQIKNGWILEFTPGELPEVETPDGEKITLSFADRAQRTVFTTEQQVWVQNGITVTNDKAASTSNVADYAAPARFYKSSKVTLECAGMKTIVVNCNTPTYAEALKNSIGTAEGVTVTVNGTAVTVELAAATDKVVVETLTAQVRVDSIDIYK